LGNSGAAEAATCPKLPASVECIYWEDDVQVEQVMTRKAVTVAPGATLEAAEAIMQRGRFRHLPVVEDGRLVGVVSEREVRPPDRVDAQLARSLRDHTVSSVMQRGVITVAPEDSLEHAAQLLHTNEIGCLPVLRGRDLAGIITTSDIFNAFVRSAGFLEPSTRIEVQAPDLARTLGAIAAVATSEHVPIAGLVSEHDETSGERRVVVRFSSLQGPRIAAALRAGGVELVGPDPAAEG
jgi:acetoin utilization protein AcuB